jgi:hypothetical protein
MSPPPTPLEATDKARADDLKLKIFGRLKDLKRHLDALRSAMAKFGENFDEAEFVAAHASSDPDELNMVKAVERGVDQLYNYMAELTRFGLELAEVREGADGINAGRDFRDLQDIKVLSAQRTAEVRTLQQLRRLIVHEYDQATAVQIREAALVVERVLPPFADAYMKWLRSGFVVPGVRD